MYHSALYRVPYIVYRVPYIVYRVPYIVHRISCFGTVYHISCTVYRALVPYTVYLLISCTVYRVPYTVYHIPCTLHRVSCADQLTKLHLFEYKPWYLLFKAILSVLFFQIFTRLQLTLCLRSLRSEKQEHSCTVFI